MIIVSNTGPIIALAKIQKLALLKDLASEVLIPPAVHRELFGKVGRESQEIDRALSDFIHVAEVTEINPEIITASLGLDEGEKQVIALASTLTGEVVLLIDDRAGRRVAQQLGLSTVGAVGVLLYLKEQGIIENLESLLLEMRERGYWLSDKVIEIAKRLSSGSR